MDYHIDEFYQCITDEIPHGNFQNVIPLHRRNDLTWDDVLQKVPQMDHGWYELSRISSKDRIEFTYDHWELTLAYNPKLERCLEAFFGSLDDIGIFLVQKSWEDPFEAHMVYSISGNSGFYRGGLPIKENPLQALQKCFSNYTLPADYLAFLQLHDGFWKTSDCTGIVKSAILPERYEKFQTLLAEEPSLSTSKGELVDPKSLIPFYESFGMPYYQCFWGEWYPEQEMGNVYYSSTTKTISNVRSEDTISETLAFPTFNDWLAFYLERVE